MNTPKDSETRKKRKNGFSRRGFLSGLGLGTGAIGAGVLEAPAEAAPDDQAQWMGPGEVSITLDLNGKPTKLTVEPRTTLLDALRNGLDLTAAKRVCDRGTCGACTVIMNGKAVYACAVLAIDAQGKPIQTLEGVAATRHPIVNAFVANDAQQCGYCTPGFVMAAKDFLDHNPSPTPDQINAGLGGNLCRCGTYMGVRKAVLEASRELKGGRKSNG